MMSGSRTKKPFLKPSVLSEIVIALAETAELLHIAFALPLPHAPPVLLAVNEMSFP